jgi:hypothetical protein
MISSSQITDALVDWAREVVPTLEGGYDYVPAEKDEPLPDVVVEVMRTYIDPDAAAGFAEIRIEQRRVRVWMVDISIMVDNADPEAAAAYLRDTGDLLMAAWLAPDRSLGGRVPFTSPFASIDSSTPFVEYEDGTKGREMTMSVAVGDLVEAD